MEGEKAVETRASWPTLRELNQENFELRTRIIMLESKMTDLIARVEHLEKK